VSGHRRRTVAEALYRVLLLCYPRDFRGRHGREMILLFLERERDAAARGKRITCWWGASVDAVRNGVGERLDAVGRRLRGAGSEGLDRDGERIGGGGMDALARDAAYAIRSLAKSPGFAAVAVLTIGLGIGANTAIFSVVRAVLLAPLPYDEPGELFVAWGQMRNRGVLTFPTSPPDFKDYQDQADLVEEMGAVFTFQAPLTGDGEPEQVEVGFVTPNFFRMLGITPILGRDFVSSDGTPNEAGVQPGSPGSLPTMVILSHALWQQRWGGDPGVVGRTIELQGPAEIVGVLPAGFELLMPAAAALASAPDLWTAMRVDFVNSPRNNVFLRPVGRLREGVTLEQAQAQVDRIAVSLASEDPVKTSAGYAVRLAPLQSELTADVRPVILALFGAVVFVLLIACANVSNLLLVRAAGRRRELAVRAALGGSRTRIVRQLLMESGIVAGMGALVGVVLAMLGVRALLALRPDDLPRIANVGIDGPVLGFAIAAAAGAALLFGLLPSLQASRVDLADSLNERGQAGSGTGRALLRNAVVVGEVALSLVLLIGAGLMMRSFVELSRVEPGYDPDDLVTFEVAIPFNRYPQPSARSELAAALRLRMEAIPGVVSAGAAFPMPLSGRVFNGRYGGEEARVNPEAFRQAGYRGVLPGYFEAMGTRLLAGRVFTEADFVDSAAVVLVDEKLARTLWPSESAVGKRFLVRATSQEPEEVEVIGVVEHQRHESLAAEGMETVFFTDRYLGGFATTWAVRAGVDPLTLLPAIRSAVGAVDAELPVADVRTMRDRVDEAMGPTRFALTLIGVFGAIAMLLATVGLYGVLASVVRQRTPEIGVRMAFGAESRAILRLVVRQGLGLAGLGIAVGLVAALLLTGVIESMLVGVRPTDPVTFAAIGAGFVLVSLLACWIPARRAARVDPVVALREE